MNAAALQRNPTLFVRPYESKDLDAVGHVFRETADTALRRAGDQALHIASYIWCRPYLFLNPSTCFVLDDGTNSGMAVGYILATPDTKTFVRDYEARYLPFLENEGLSRPNMTNKASWDDDIPATLLQMLHSPASSLLHEDFPSLVEKYPAHLHIDILPAFQRQGHGRKLMYALCAQLEELRARGVHLIMSGTNHYAGKFYAALGFGRFGDVVDGGVSGEVGRDRNRGVWLVRALGQAR